VRFTQAVPLNSSWTDSHTATAYPPSCIGYGGDDIGYALSEDCLYLNVIRPAGINASSALPVATWIHGGGLFMGGSSDRRYNLSFVSSITMFHTGRARCVADKAIRSSRTASRTARP
jgi:carboxylesterase type B